MTTTDRAPKKKTENKDGGLGGRDVAVCVGVWRGDCSGQQAFIGILRLVYQKERESFFS